ncbi:MAG: protein-glutamate O-methyltransferase [Pseudomonadota bacterium]
MTVLSNSAAFSGNREMPDDVFAAIISIAHAEAGLLITEKKRALVQSRITRRLRALKIKDFRDYIDFVKSTAGAEEVGNMISVLTTNVSSFFREEHHFETIRSDIAPKLITRAKENKRIRIWSAGCSTGQEPFTLAMLLKEMEPRIFEYDVKVLATDIDPNVISHALAARYDALQMSSIPDDIQSKYFKFDAGADRSGIVIDEIRQAIEFRQLNLLKDWPMKRKFDIIMCRNVVIYFDEETQARLWPKFRNQLADDGHLFIGHSERIIKPDELGFEPAGITMYRAA